MFSDARRMLSLVCGVFVETLSGLSRLGLKIFLFLAAVEAVLMGILNVVARVRGKFRQEPREGFPWEKQLEIELESGGECLKIYPAYSELYEAMLEEIEQAERTIFIETFIWKDDEIGRRFVNALARKAREGVEVYAIFDAVANIPVPASFKRFPEEIHTLRFRPFSSPASFLNPYNFVRDHRKILAVDGRVAFLGGFNIGNLFTRWRDTHLRVRGDLVHEVENAFEEFWNTHRSDDLPEISLAQEKRSWKPATTLRTNDPTMGLFPIRDMFLGPIDRASSHVYLTTPYLIPSRSIKEDLMEAPKRGVDVQVLVPKESNHILADWLAQRHFGELLRAGVRLFEYDEHFMIHSKSLTIDGAWSTVGSANIDSLSLFLLHEINLEVYSERFAEQLEEVFEVDKTNAKEITLKTW